MNGRKGWIIQSFFICFICNGALVAYFVYSKNLTAFAIAAGGITLALWLLVAWTSPVSPPPQKVEKPKARGVSPAPVPAASPEAAVQLLAALQREGRLIDFLQEDIGLYDDAQIGAAVRNIHTGCKTALAEQMEIQPVLREEEGASITVPSGFDPKSIRLTGTVTGNPPFRGVLRHRGWQAERVRLPQSGESKGKWILAPAEVEVG